VVGERRLMKKFDPPSGILPEFVQQSLTIAPSIIEIAFRILLCDFQMLLPIPCSSAEANRLSMLKPEDHFVSLTEAYLRSQEDGN
jgi:hypothetical protein